LDDFVFIRVHSCSFVVKIKQASLPAGLKKILSDEFAVFIRAALIHVLSINLYG